MQILIWISKILVIFVGGILLFIFACLVFIDAPDIKPVAFTPDPQPRFKGPLAVNTELRKVNLLGEGKLKGPEDVAVGMDGSILTSNEDGTIKRIQPDGSVENFARTEGRPLGLVFDPIGNLIVCDPGVGLLSISLEGKVTILVEVSVDVPLYFPNDVDVAPDGSIYFSDVTSNIFGHDTFYDILVHRPFGRLLKYDPTKGIVEVVEDSLYYANGVSVSHDGSFVVVTELGAYQITRFWIDGSRKGEREVFATNLPGYPDGIMSDGKGNFWLSIVSPRDRIVDEVYSPRVWVKQFLMLLPKWLRPGATSYGLVVKLDETGKIIESLHDPSGERISNVSNVVEKNGKLYLANLYGDAIGVYDLE